MSTLAPSAPQRAHLRARWRRWRFPVLAAVVFLVVTTLLTLATGRTSDRPLAADNPGGDGGRALAQILGAQGVRVREATTVAEVAALAGPGTTVLVTDLSALTPDQRADVAGTGADLVLTGATYLTFDGLDEVEDRLEPSGVSSGDPLPARCDVPAARAAGSVSGTSGSVVVEGPDTTLCFPVDGEAGAYALVDDDGRAVHYVADRTLLSNDRLAEAGNAALALHVLGAHETLVWFVPSPVDTSSGTDTVPPLPPQVGAALAMAGVAFVVLALWRGRRLGPVVTEEMPVVVRAAETTRGRGRLYRRFRAHGHAAAALRAGAAARIARTLSLPGSADAETLVDALARRTGRPAPEVRALLYGPAPTDDTGLVALAAALDTLEREVHRP